MTSGHSSPPRSGGAPVRALGSLGRVLGHSLLPFVALAILLGTLVWGPWVSLGLTVLWWKTVTRIG